jgi:hypothetical protein
MATTIPHWIDGESRDGGDRTAEVTDPAIGRVTGEVQLADDAMVDAAVAAAVATFHAWRDSSLFVHQTKPVTARRVHGRRTPTASSRPDTAPVASANRGTRLPACRGGTGSRSPGHQGTALRHARGTGSARPRA